MAETTKSEITEPGWGWMIPEDDVVHGPFDTKDACLDDAREYLLDSSDAPLTVVGIDVGRCIYPAPEDFVPIDLDDILERMDEMAGDNGFFADDQNFYADDGAREALEATLAAWAKGHIHATIWTLQDTERVDLVFCGPAAPIEVDDG